METLLLSLLHLLHLPYILSDSFVHRHLPSFTVEDIRPTMSASSKVNMRSKRTQAASSSSGCLDTPPDSPTAQLSNPFEFAKQVLDVLKTIQTPEPKEASPAVGSSGPQIKGNAQASKPIARASKLEAKEVHEV
jgi:hypothetical protein